jgi:CelD/BcsL family acetyltransferase involved in cellulose biosynthesis
MLSVLFLEDIGLMVDAMSSASSTLAARLRPLAAQDQAADTANVAVFQGAGAVEQASADWQTLERAGGGETPFQTFAMARAATDVHLRRGEVPRVAVLRREGRPVVIFPTVLVNRYGLTVARFLGDPLIQYGDVLCEPGTAKRDLVAAWQAAADPSAAHAIHLRKVRADARIAPVLRDVASASNNDEAPFLDTTRTCDNNGEEPRQLRRARRKLASLGALRLTVSQGDIAREHLRDALAIKRSWLAARQLPSSVIGDCEWEEALTQLAGHGGGMHLRVAMLSVADRPAAYEVAFTKGDRWYAFIGAIVEEFARHSPGRVQVADTIAHCRSNGFARYDLLAPSDEVKRGYCSGAVKVSDYSSALRPAGHLLSAAARLSPAAKTLFVRLPAALRKPILALAGR